ncbi:Cyclic di-GMP phosphodiesterase response regulator RpfG [Planctomycetes bacterium CA13]|uniref:Cyclic di-GMP phosphodiesterase response regulator RpfG n=1 Tax=Novipirellula herctigrandis TaxID=2527986 RepID=A0A5C5YP43_9BACT|nr:Cyclic di-GMP phosphodiesterase response regulator RpfG [Planctomycetes bacterium CA13]
MSTPIPTATPPNAFPTSESAASMPVGHGKPTVGNTAARSLHGKIMIVDDEIANVLVAKKHLERAGYYMFETTTDSSVAVNLICSTRPDVVLLDINMPDVNGVEILRQVRHRPEFRHLPILILTANNDAEIKHSCLELGATDFLVKPVDPMELVPRVRNSLQIKSYHDQLENHAADLEEKISQRTADLEKSRREVIYCLARAAELRDNDTGNHVIRVGRFAGLIAAQLDLPQWYVEDVELAAQLHDVGKIAVPDAILLKPGCLEPEEFEVIKSHVKLGRQIIKPHTINDADLIRRHADIGCEMLRDGSSLMRLAASIAQTHHEKYDGSGYPIGLAGEDIPLEGRITAVADVYDALASERPYKKALPRQKCFDILEEGRGTHFDPNVLDAFFRASKDIVRVQVEFMDFCTPATTPAS